MNWDYLSPEAEARLLATADMSKMYLAPPDILGHYCSLDADATWQLWQYLRTVNPKVTQFHQRFFMPQVRLMLQQAFKGMIIDRDVLLRGRAQLQADMTAAHAGFFNSPGVASYAAGEPTKLTPKGNITSRWRAWNKAQKAGTQLELNINSKAQLADLFFNHLGCRVIKTTPTGKPALDKKILPALGPEGKLLAIYNKLKKQDGYVKKVVQLSPSGLIRPTFNTVGTVTLRPSGTGGFNMLQMPKTPAFLASFVARPGHKLVQADLEALEPTILTQFSHDPTMMSIYGPDAKPNDIYLYVAARIPALGKNILQYYDPANPTKEGIKLAKEHCKRDRQVAKTVQLASAYGAGAQKIYDTLMLDGIQITLPEVRGIMRDYWQLFAGVKRFEAQLQGYWQQSGGYIPSIIGTPICVDAKYTKDLVNRFCQTSAAIVLQIWVTFADELFRSRQIPATPWNLNMYDETVWEVPDAYADAAAKILADALTMANQFLQAEIPFKAPPMICDNMAQWKCPDTYQQWKDSQP
jgi:DNA polymerase I-like protein with 3'-5' exonuclease and polymerase domains